MSICKLNSFIPCKQYISVPLYIINKASLNIIINTTRMHVIATQVFCKIKDVLTALNKKQK